MNSAVTGGAGVPGFLERLPLPRPDLASLDAGPVTMLPVKEASSTFPGVEASLEKLAGEGLPATLFTPAYVSDRGDGKIAHLDGLNLSRAWCWRSIAARLRQPHSVCALAEGAAERHLAASLPHLADDYMGTHWLATFALLALDGL